MDIPMRSVLLGNVGVIMMAVVPLTKHLLLNGSEQLGEEILLVSETYNAMQLVEDSKPDHVASSFGKLDRYLIAKFQFRCGCSEACLFQQLMPC